MTGVDVRSLILKLDRDATQGVEKAIALAVASTHHTVGLLHFVSALLDGSESILTFDLSGANRRDMQSEIASALSRKPRGNASVPAFDDDFVELLSKAWMDASLQGAARLDIVSILAAVRSEPGVFLAVSKSCPIVAEWISSLDAKSTETSSSAAGTSAETAGKFLAEYATDLTDLAEKGLLDPVIGRERELAQVVDVLLRRRQNNPILLGEAGVGKTAIAEAFAMAVVAGDVPERLKDVRVQVLDLALLQAGASVKGEFERRLKGVIDEVKTARQPIILFIDEAHTLIGAGNQAGQNDAANLLKPALARGELRTIAATTWSEYKRYIEKDPALTRRFEPVRVDEPDIRTAVRILRAVAPLLEKHHGVTITEDGLEAAVTLSARYIPSRQLPDKAVSLLDTAAAAVAVSRGSQPFELRALIAERDLLATELASSRKDRLSLKAARRRPALEAALERTCQDIADVERRLALEDAKLSELDAARTMLSDAGDGDVQHTFDVLGTLQGDAPLRHHSVDQELVASLIARATGIPAGKLLADQIEVARSLEDRLSARVKGQDQAIGQIARMLKIAKVGLSDASKPPAVFLFLGMSGVGKTETAHAIADALYGGPQYLTVLNMSEYKEEHRASQLLGAPAGYVGFGEGGVLTEAVRRRPYGVLLLDEMEKAHPSIQEMFYQVFDKGTLRDGEGRDVDFRNTTIIMTANTASSEISALAGDPETFPDTADALLQAIRPALLQDFKPAFVGRLSPVVFRPLGDAALAGIVAMQLEKVRDRIRAVYDSDLVIDPSVERHMILRSRAGDTGARAIQATIALDVLPALSDFLLDALSRKSVPPSIQLMCDDDGRLQVAAADSVVIAPTLYEEQGVLQPGSGA